MRHDRLVVGLIEDDVVMGESICHRLELEGCSVRWWQSGKEAIARCPQQLESINVMVCDIRLPDMTGEEVFKRLVGDGPPPPFVFITGYGEIDQAVRLMRMGAADYVTKPFEFEDFLTRIRENARMLPHDMEELGALGVSADMRAVEDLVRRYAATDLPVLITGETGVGKEVTANLLHSLGAGAGGPIMAVNCAAIPSDLLESELFGHDKGAFTGASRQHLGYAERAGAGTLFLDEIGDMSLAMQSKLLRLIEDHRFHRIGGERLIPFEARIISATNRDLGAAVAEKWFREDLYFRLSVLPIHIKPLRERPPDIIWLMVRLLADACARHDKHVRGFSPLTEEAALAHAWPGNIREMKNRIERAVALGAEDWIMPGDLFPEQPGPASTDALFSSLAATRDSAERRQIERALARTSGQVQAAAKLLAISRTTLWEKMVRLGLRPE